MIKSICLAVFFFVLFAKSFAIDRNNSKNEELLVFLEEKGYITDSMHCDFNSCVDIFDIAKNSQVKDLDEYEFGIFRFRYIGCEDCGYYILIKDDDKSTVYEQNCLDMILKELLRIKKEKPHWISGELFENYVEALSDIEIGLNSGRLLICEKIGNINYIHD